MRYVLAAVVLVLFSAACASRVGQDAHVRNATGSVLAASYLDDLAAGVRAGKAGDQTTMQTLTQTQRLVSLPNETRVHVLHAYASLGYYDVRVLEGTYAGDEMWIRWDDLA